MVFAHKEHSLKRDTRLCWVGLSVVLAKGTCAPNAQALARFTYIRSPEAHTHTRFTYIRSLEARTHTHTLTMGTHLPDLPGRTVHCAGDAGQGRLWGGLQGTQVGRCICSHLTQEPEGATAQAPHGAVCCSDAVPQVPHGAVCCSDAVPQVPHEAVCVVHTLCHKRLQELGKVAVHVRCPAHRTRTTLVEKVTIGSA